MAQVSKMGRLVEDLRRQESGYLGILLKLLVCILLHTCMYIIIYTCMYTCTCRCTCIATLYILVIRTDGQFIYMYIVTFLRTVVYNYSGAMLNINYVYLYMIVHYNISVCVYIHVHVGSARTCQPVTCWGQR